MKGMFPELKGSLFALASREARKLRKENVRLLREIDYYRLVLNNIATIADTAIVNGDKNDGIETEDH